MLNVEVSQVLGQFDLAEHRLIKLSLIDFCGDLFHRFRGAMLSFNRFIHINRIRADTNISRCGFRTTKIGLSHLMGCSIVVIEPILPSTQFILDFASSHDFMAWIRDSFDHLLLPTTKPFSSQIICGMTLHWAPVSSLKGMSFSWTFKSMNLLFSMHFSLKAAIKNACSSLVLSFSLVYTCEMV